MSEKILLSVATGGLTVAATTQGVVIAQGEKQLGLSLDRAGWRTIRGAIDLAMETALSAVAEEEQRAKQAERERR